MNAPAMPLATAQTRPCQEGQEEMEPISADPSPPRFSLDRIRDGFQADRIPHVKVAVTYRIGLALVALAMVLLPLIYLALIAATAWGVWLYATHATVLFESAHGRGMILCFLLYATPLLAGATVVFFMFKPLLARRSSGPEPHVLLPGQHPVLEEFVGRICRAVGAPLPRRIQVTCDVNASASPSSGLFSLLAGNLTLTIGLPLAGLPLRSFGGILAHEFGHFTQGGGMTLTYLIRSINHWFARVVYERDGWDQRLENAAAEADDWRIQIPLQVCRGGVWLSRCVLRVLMQTGHAVSCFAMRQMEYDADACEAGFAGSQGVADTFRLMREMNHGNADAVRIVSTGWKSGRLARNLPLLACERTSKLPEEILRTAHLEGETGKTGIWDTHPCDADRIRAAAALNLDGIFSLDAPASVLFEDFAGLCELSTILFYRDQIGLNLEKAELVDNSLLVGNDDAMRDAHDRLRRYFHGRFDLDRPWVPDMPDLTTEALEPEQIREMADHLREASETHDVDFGAFDAAGKRRLTCLKAEALVAAGFTIQPKEFGLLTGSTKAAREGADTALAEMESRAMRLEPFNRLAADRLTAGLRRVMDTEPGQRRTIESFVATLQQLASVFPVVRELREKLIVHAVLMANARADVPGLRRSVENNAERARVLRSSLDDLLAEVPYPFDHAPPMHRLLEVIQAAEAGSVEAEAPAFHNQILRANAAADQVYQLAFRLLGSLVAMAAAAEAEL